MKEELDTVIEVHKLLDTIEYDYPEFHLSMRCYLCSVIHGTLKLCEHKDAKMAGQRRTEQCGLASAEHRID